MVRVAQITEFPEYYITDDGRVFSDKTNKYKAAKRVTELRGFINKGGYKYVDFVDGSNHKRFGVHQLVAQYFCEGYFEGAVVDHIDANKLNNNYYNLQWVSQKDNIIKSYKDSGVNQCRNYKGYKLTSPNGDIYKFYNGYQDVINFIVKNKVDTSPLSLRYYKKCKGWKLNIYNKNEVINDE